MAEQKLAYIKSEGVFYVLVRDETTRALSLRLKTKSEWPDPLFVLDKAELSEAIRDSKMLVVVLKNGEIKPSNYEGRNVDFAEDTVPEALSHNKFQTADFFDCLGNAIELPHSAEGAENTLYISTIKNQKGQSCLVVFPATGHSSGVPIPADSNFRALMMWTLTTYVDMDKKSDKPIGYEDLLVRFLNSDYGPKFKGVWGFFEWLLGLRKLDMDSWQKLGSREFVSIENLQILFRHMAELTRNSPDVSEYFNTRAILLQEEAKEVVAASRSKKTKGQISDSRLKEARQRLEYGDSDEQYFGYDLRTLESAKRMLHLSGYEHLGLGEVAYVLNEIRTKNMESGNTTLDYLARIRN